jgi:tetratricopeptide (TPR) repeat protein
LPFKASVVGKNAKKAIELNPKNIRAYLALGIYDYYTPKMYGGMKITEENLKKAVALTEKIDPNPFAPDWGKADAYLYLVKFYNYEKKFDDAKKYLDEGLKLFPNFELLKKMKVKFEKNG